MPSELREVGNLSTLWQAGAVGAYPSECRPHGDQKNPQYRWGNISGCAGQGLAQVRKGDQEIERYLVWCLRALNPHLCQPGEKAQDYELYAGDLQHRSQEFQEHSAIPPVYRS